MELNGIEEEFFRHVLRAEQDIPIRANLKVYKQTFPVMVIPQITQRGYFELRYFGTPVPQPEIGPDGSQSWTDYAIFGVDPELEKAWKNHDKVTLELAERPHPFVLLQNTSGPRICARVLMVDNNNKGQLAIHENQVTVDKSPLTMAKFSLVDFPEIVYGGITWMQNLIAKNELDDFNNDLQSAVSRVDDENFSVHSRYLNITNLFTESGWEFTLTEDDEKTRGRKSYTGTIKRQNEEQFEIQQLRHVLEGLTKFFSLVTCAFRHPTAVIARDAKNRVAWGQIGKFDLMPRYDNWFSNRGAGADSALLEFIFPKFWSKWEESQDEFTAVINYYVNSRALQQKGFPQNAVATIYAGLDLLAHLILEKPHRKKSVSNIESALRQHDIPYLSLDETKTPIAFQASQRLNSKQSGVELLNQVRNYVAHPIDFDDNIIKQAPLLHLDRDYHPYFYIHDLGQFYLEYLLLKEMCDFAPQHHRPLFEQLHR